MELLGCSWLMSLMQFEISSIISLKIVFCPFLSLFCPWSSLLLYLMVFPRSLRHCSLFFILIWNFDHFYWSFFKFTDSVFCQLMSHLLFNPSSEFFSFQDCSIPEFSCFYLFMCFIFMSFKLIFLWEIVIALY